MSKENRIDLIKQIQEKRNSVVFSYLTSTRKNLEVQMAMDSIRKFFEHLKLIEKDKQTYNIDLFLYSNGGDGTVPWRLVTLLREYAKNFSVIIPYRAFSAATLTSLGADEILMHPMGMLGPTDPTVSNDFNPDAPDGKNKIGISVEDVTAYLNLIKEDAGITHQDELVNAFNLLAQKVHPLALGNVKRSLSQSRMMAKKLLALHMSMGKQEHEINEIVDNLTSKLYYHGHPINRSEAIEQVGIKTIKHPDEELEDLIWSLYEGYDEELLNEYPFRPVYKFIEQYPNLSPNDGVKTLQGSERMVFIESEKRTDYFEVQYNIFGNRNKESLTFNTQLSTLFEGWKVDN